MADRKKPPIPVSIDPTAHAALSMVLGDIERKLPSYELDSPESKLLISLHDKILSRMVPDISPYTLR